MRAPWRSQWDDKQRCWILVAEGLSQASAARLFHRLAQAIEALLATLEAHFHGAAGPTFQPAQDVCDSV